MARTATPTVPLPAHRPPGPRARYPGQLVGLLRRDILGYLTHLARAHGDVVYLRPLVQGMYLLSHPDAIRDVLVTQESAFIKGPALRQAKDTLGDGLLTSEGDFHRRQRRLAQPAFHATRVNSYGQAITHYAARLADRWQDGQVLDVHEQMMQFTLAVVAKTLFDADVEPQVEAIGRAMDTSVKMFTRAMVPYAWLLNYLPLPSNFRFYRARAYLNETVRSFITQRRASGVDRGDLLSMLLAAHDTEGDGSGMSDAQLRDECITLFTAGHETTANALTFTWLLLAEHPEAEAKLHEELARVLGGRVPTVADLPRLEYARMVFAESMRLYPPAWALGRETIREVEVGGWRLGDKAVVLLSQWVTHRDPRWWPDPERFDPERFRPGAFPDRPRYAYFPFGGGVRSCIGESFAWLEGILAIATFAQRWRMARVETGPVALLPTITLRPRHAMRVRVTRRPD